MERARERKKMALRLKRLLCGMQTTISMVRMNERGQDEGVCGFFPLIFLVGAQCW
jgi:hypothetical protein